MTETHLNPSRCGSCGHWFAPGQRACPRCGQPQTIAEPLTLTQGRHVGRYELCRRLGTGAMGEVWAARLRGTSHEFALKFLHPVLASQPRLLQRTRREAEALNRITHPNVVQLHETLVADSSLVLVLELVRGGSLADALAELGPLPPSRVKELTCKLLAGLGAIHRAGYVHRDIKPANVLLDERGNPKLTDLGIAHDTVAKLTATGALLGTLEYMSPEQVMRVSGSQLTPAADIYAVGVVAYELLTGRPPFLHQAEFALMQAHLQQEPDLSKLPTRTPPQIESAIAVALRKNPLERWPSADAMIRALADETTGVAAASAVTGAPRCAHVPAVPRQSARADSAPAGVADTPDGTGATVPTGAAKGTGNLIRELGVTALKATATANLLLDRVAELATRTAEEKANVARDLPSLLVSPKPRRGPGAVAWDRVAFGALLGFSTGGLYLFAALAPPAAEPSLPSEVVPLGRTTGENRISAASSGNWNQNARNALSNAARMARCVDDPALIQVEATFDSAGFPIHVEVDDPRSTVSSCIVRTLKIHARAPLFRGPPRTVRTQIHVP